MKRALATNNYQPSAFKPPDAQKKRQLVSLRGPTGNDNKTYHEKQRLLVTNESPVAIIHSYAEPTD